MNFNKKRPDTFLCAGGAGYRASPLRGRSWQGDCEKLVRPSTPSLSHEIKLDVKRK